MWTFSEKLIVLTCCIRNWHYDSNGDLNRGSNHKSRDLKVRFEPAETRRVPPCAVKTCAVRPVFARVAGELRAADPSNAQGPVKQSASQANNLRLRDEGGSRGRSRTQNQKTRTVSTYWSSPGGISLRDSDLGESLVIWAPRFQITSDLRFAIWST